MNKKKNPKIKILAVPNVTSLLPPQPPTMHVHIKKHAFAWVIIYGASSGVYDLGGALQKWTKILQTTNRKSYVKIVTESNRYVR